MVMAVVRIARLASELVGFAVTMSVVMMPVIMMAVIMAMRGMARIGAAHWIERFRRVRHGGSKPLEHGLDDMVAQNEDAARFDGGRQMTVADVPC